jgi:probable F420-dependent oxidoreductase
MLFGVSIFATEYATYIPASRRSPWPGGKELPKEYWHTYDPFITLTAAATVTIRLRIATGICLVIERDPIITAKEVASLDQLSGGRFIFGIGGGWNAEEMGNHGTDFKRRWRVLRERILAMKEIWTKEEVEFHGEFVNFDKIWSYPKPVQKPHPPILMGGDGPKTFDRIIEFCDGWIPTGIEPSVLSEKITILRQRAEAAGRDPKISVSIVYYFYDTNPDQRTVDELEKAGVERVIFGLPSASKETLLPLLDKYAALIP